MYQRNKELLNAIDANKDLIPSIWEGTCDLRDLPLINFKSNFNKPTIDLTMYLASLEEVGKLKDLIDEVKELLNEHGAKHCLVYSLSEGSGYEAILTSLSSTNIEKSLLELYSNPNVILSRYILLLPFRNISNSLYYRLSYMTEALLEEHFGLKLDNSKIESVSGDNNRELVNSENLARNNTFRALKLNTPMALPNRECDVEFKSLVKEEVAYELATVEPEIELTKHYLFKLIDDHADSITNPNKGVFLDTLRFIALLLNQSSIAFIPNLDKYISESIMLKYIMTFSELVSYIQEFFSPDIVIDLELDWATKENTVTFTLPCGETISLVTNDLDEIDIEPLNIMRDTRDELKYEALETMLTLVSKASPNDPKVRLLCDVLEWYAQHEQ